MSTIAVPMSKKHVETVYLERFKALFSAFPSGKVTSTEEPDFLVVGSAGVIGIELTELHRVAQPGTEPLQAIEMMRHRVASRAQAIYELTGLPPVRCTIFMNEARIKKSEVETLAAAIADLAVRNLPTPNSSREECYEWTNRMYFPELIHSISIHRYTEITENFFTTPGCTWSLPLASSDIERVLSAKESKCKAYRTRCTELWLLVNADIGLMSTWLDFDLTAASVPFKSNFDRVFFLSHFSNQLHELPLTNSMCRLSTSSSAPCVSPAP